MSVAVAQRTMGQVFVEVAKLTGDFWVQGTATAGTTTTLTDAGNFRVPVTSANAALSHFLYIFGGTGAGQAREISSYGTIGVMTWTTAGTAPDTTSTWVVVRRNPQDIIDAIGDAQRLLQMGHALPYDCTSLVTNNLLGCYGDFEEWGAGTTSQPDAWILAGAGGTIARTAQTLGSDIRVAHGLYSAGITPGAGAVCTLTHQLSGHVVRGIAGQDVYLRGAIMESVASDVVVRITTTTTAGTAANTDRTGTLASYRLQELADLSETAIALPANLIDVTCQVRVAANASVAYVDNLALFGPTLYDYDLPASLVALKPVIYLADQETGVPNGDYTRPQSWGRPLRHGEDWELRSRPGSNADVLHFNRALPEARHLLIQGLQSPAVVTSATTNLNCNADAVAQIAAARLKQKQPDPNLLAEAKRMRRYFSTTNAPYIWVRRT